MDFITKRKLSSYSSLITLSVSVITLLGWALEIPIFRSFIPGLPPMIPMTAFVTGILALSLFLISSSVEDSSSFRSKLAAGCCTFAMSIAIYMLSSHIFDFSWGLELLLFRDQLLSNENQIAYFGRMSVQTSLATVFLSSSLLIFRQPGSLRGVYIFDGLLIATAALCLVAIIGYTHEPKMSGMVKFVGLSFPSIVSFFLLATGTIFLKRNQGLVKILSRRDGAGFFLRWYLVFSILFPFFSSALISWGERQGNYPTSFSKTAFVVVTIVSLIIMGIFMSFSIRKLEAQRAEIEKAEAKAALDESQESLMRTKESLEIALEASMMGTWETDLKTDLVMFSGTAKSLLGFTADVIPSQVFFAGIHPEDRAECEYRRRLAVEEGVDLNVDFRYILADASIRWMRSKARTKRNEKGVATRLSGTILDITAEKNREARLEEALKEAESASNLKSSFLANMSHEIRTPLGAILGFADVLSDPQLPWEEHTRYLQIIQRNGETLSQLLNDILDLSKVESGHLDIEKINFPLKSAVSEVTSLLEVQAKERNLSLTVEYSEDVQTSVTSDPIRLKQILMNLIGNALKFTNQGSVSIRVRPQNSQLVFEIEDTGVGIEVEKQRKLFKPFSQADSSITRIFGGTGLGLVLSKKLAELLGGTIELKRSEVGKGSLFVLSIENYDNARAPEPAKDSASVQRGGKLLEDRRILLTEDSPDIQKLLTLILKKEGASVDVALNGRDCLQKYLQQDYDLILMDIQMPIMDGYSATRELRSRGYKRPVIALTAHAMSDEYQRCLQAGCDAYLSKPVNRKQLIDMILDVLGRV